MGAYVYILWRFQLNTTTYVIGLTTETMAVLHVRLLRLNIASCTKYLIAPFAAKIVILTRV